MQRILSVAVVVLVVAVACLLMGGAHGEPADTRAFSPTEVVVLSGWVYHGDTLPVPVYADGTEATQDECHWIVSSQKQGDYWGGDAGDEIYYFICGTADDTWPPEVIAYVKTMDGKTGNGNANYMIVAARHDQQSSTQRQSWGAIKGGFR
jgi:hypothetical protein